MKAWGESGRSTVSKYFVEGPILSKSPCELWSKALLITTEEADTFEDQLASLVNEKDCFRVKFNFDRKLTLNLWGDDAQNFLNI